MKTLSYVKQAMAVALLISAAQASAGDVEKKKAGTLSKLGSGVYTVYTYPATILCALAGRLPYPFTKHAADVTVEGKVVKKKDSWFSLKDKLSVESEVGKNDSVLDVVNSYGKTKTFALVAGSTVAWYLFGKVLAAGYKKLFGTKTEEVVTEGEVEVQEEAEPVVVAQEEQQPKPVAASKKSRQLKRNPVV